MSSFRRFRSVSTLVNRFNSLQERIRIPEKWKSGILGRWGEFWRGIYLDYKGVAFDVIEEVKTKPRKALLIASGVGLILGAAKTNPDERSFHDDVVKCTSDMFFVSEPIRNPVAEGQLKFLGTCENQGLLRYVNLILFSVIMLEDYNPDCKVYAAQCTYLRPRYVTFYERIIDVGVYGTWLNLTWKMRDYDVNPLEWENSPPS